MDYLDMTLSQLTTPVITGSQVAGAKWEVLLCERSNAKRSLLRSELRSW